MRISLPSCNAKIISGMLLVGEVKYLVVGQKNVAKKPYWLKEK